MAEKKTTTETAAKKAAAPKKACATKKTCAKKATPTLYITAENVGFRAGDVYQTLANAEGPLSVKEIAKVIDITDDIRTDELATINGMWGDDDEN